MHWQPRAKIDDPALRALEAAWEGWLRPGGLPSRAMFDPMDFPQLLPWMVLAEIVDHTNTIRSYDVMFRYLGREFERYFNAANMARVHLSHVGPPISSAGLPSMTRRLPIPGRITLRARLSGPVMSTCRSRCWRFHSPRSIPVTWASCFAPSRVSNPTDAHPSGVLGLPAD